jgi:hypothetical protein
MDSICKRAGEELSAKRDFFGCSGVLRCDACAGFGRKNLLRVFPKKN